MKTLIGIGAVLAAVVIFFLGRWSASRPEQEAQGSEHSEHGAQEKGEAVKPQLWTCPMHPQIKLPDPGPCPICRMDLVPFVKDGLGPRQFAMSEAARKLAQIETTRVVRRTLTVPIRLLGKVDFDETVIKTIASRVPGRLDRLYVDYTGVPVTKGEHLVWLYSPELLTAQEELLEAARRVVDTKAEASSFLAESNKKAYQSAKEKLLLWGLTKAQIEEIERRGTAADHMMITSPVSGVVIHKALNEGDYVKEGTRVYQIADLRHLWIRLDAYEQDLPWIRYGQSVSISTEAMPGQSFEGWISFVDPVLDPRTRTVKVRVNVENEDGRLKPGMFVRARVEARVAGSGKVIDPQLAGKWICPMHPEVVKDGSGDCRICGMPLKPAEELGHIAQEQTEKPLVVPTSAVLVTGKRAVVYVWVPGKKRPTYEGREVVLGPRAGDHYIILEGLKENEQVVTRGAFRIDSSLQILAKPSMMSQKGDQPTYKGRESAAFRASMVSVFEAYLEVQVWLAKDDRSATRKGMQAMVQALSQVQDSTLPRRARGLWDEEKKTLVERTEAGSKAETIDEQRVAFDQLSRALLAVVDTFGHAGGDKYYEAYCSMAFKNKGAAWLQRGQQIDNPYFGASMLRCGEIRNEYPAMDASAGSSDATPRDEPSSRPSGKKAAPAKAAGKTGAVPAGRLDAMLVDYLALHEALAADDAVAAGGALAKFASSSTKTQGGSWDKPAKTALEKIRAALTAGAKLQDLVGQRKTFDVLSKEMLILEGLVGHTAKTTYYHTHCTMAFSDRGASWIQTDKEIRNPYFGAGMYRCGDVVKELPGRGGR